MLERPALVARLMRQFLASVELVAPAGPAAVRELNQVPN
jgi:hypothetical protein